jgi:threonine/homoserine/homoserine lactone efflux protein
MESSLTPTNIVALTGIMVMGALVPSVSVLAVSARSAAFGFAHGVLTSVGIVVGDVVFILIAIYGLSVLADLMGSHFALIKYLGGAYLIWLGITLWRSRPKAEGVEENSKTSMPSSFLTGLLITLADQKAILFYFGFLPCFYRFVCNISCRYRPDSGHRYRSSGRTKAHVCIHGGKSRAYF